MFVIIGLVLQAAPTVFAGQGGALTFLDVKATDAKVNTGKGGKGQNLVTYNLGNQTGQHNQGNQNGQGGQNQNGQFNNGIYQFAPSQGAHYGNAYVLNGIGEIRTNIRKGNFNVRYPNQQVQQNSQNQWGNVPPKGMSDRQWQWMMLQQQQQWKREDRNWSRQNQVDDRNQQLQMIEQARLREEAQRRQQIKQQQTMMGIQMFGAVVGMALMTHQQNREQKNARKYYQQEAQRNRQFYLDKEKYRRRYKHW